MKYVMMGEGEEFYLNPIPLGYYLYPHLKDGTLDIADLVDINDHIAVSAENERLRREADK